MRPATAAYDFDRAFREVLTCAPRRPGWLGGVLLTVRILRAVLVIPVLLVFALFQLLAQAIQAVVGITLRLGGVVLLLGLGYIFFLLAFVKFATGAVR